MSETTRARETTIEPIPGIVVTIREAEKTDKIDLYDYCGHRIGRHFSATTGQFAKFVIFCNDYLECSTCRKRRYNYIYGRIAEAYHICLESYEDLCVVSISMESAKKLTELLGKDRLFRIPQENGSCIVFCKARGTVYEHQAVLCIREGTIHYWKTTVGHTHYMDKLYSDNGDNPGVERVPVAITISDIMKWIPRGRKSPHMSGNLGKASKVKQLEEIGDARNGGWEITVAQHLVDIPPEKEVEIIKCAMKELGPPNTDSQETLQKSVDLFCEYIRNELAKTGLPFAKTKETLQIVYPEDVQWTPDFT